jgi:hypothetical protein
MNKQPQTEEYFEASQKTADENRKIFLKSLSKEDRKKFKLVEEVNKKLVKGKIEYYLHVLLPVGKDKLGIWQYNSHLALAEFDSMGKPTRKSQERNAFFHDSYFCTLFSQFAPSLQGETLEEKLNSFTSTIYRGYTKHLKYLKPANEENHET